jgi:hypothetical protein
MFQLSRSLGHLQSRLAHRCNSLRFCANTSVDDRPPASDQLSQLPVTPTAHQPATINACNGKIHPLDRPKILRAQCNDQAQPNRLIMAKERR